MACHCAYSFFSPSPPRDFICNGFLKPSPTSKSPILCSMSRARVSYNSLVSEAVKILVPPSRFEASKLKVVIQREETHKYATILPRTYILSHCDFTANLTLTILNVICLEQLKGWYEKDDVVAEWKKVNDEMCLHLHCYVGGPNLLSHLAAEFRYRIFSKEMPLVLKAIEYGDAILFQEHPELLHSTVLVYFHSGSQKYNRTECWGPLKGALEGMQADQHQEFVFMDIPPEKRRSPKSILQTLFAFLL